MSNKSASDKEAMKYVESADVALEKAILNSFQNDRKILLNLKMQDFVDEHKAKSLVKILLEESGDKERAIYNIGKSASIHHSIDELSYAIRELEYDRKHGEIGKRMKIDEVYCIMYEYTMVRLKELRKNMDKNNNKSDECSNLTHIVNGKRQYVAAKNSPIHSYKDRMLTLWKEIEIIKGHAISAEDKDNLAYVKSRLYRNKRLNQKCRKDGQIAYLRMMLTKSINDLMNKKEASAFKKYLASYEVNSPVMDTPKS